MSAKPCICVAPFGESEWAVARGHFLEGMVSTETVIMRLPQQDEVEEFAKQVADNLHLPLYRILPGRQPELVPK